MSTASGIEWTDTTWNPVVGCTPVSPGCLNCYAATMARRLEAMGRPEYVGLTVGKMVAFSGEPGDHPGDPRTRRVFNGKVRTLEDRLTDPLHWRKPRRVFVNSMSDLFHEDVPFEFIDRVFAVMALCPQHTFQVLTKRPERMAEYLNTEDRDRTLEKAVWAWHDEQAPDYRLSNRLPEHPLSVAQKIGWRGSSERTWPLPNVWLGTSIESDDYHARAWELLKCPAAVRFLSCEPLIGPVDLNRWELLCRAWSERRPTIGRYIDWVIVGGESGAHARPCDVGWIRSIVGQCKTAEVPVFVKQLGSNFTSTPTSPVRDEVTATTMYTVHEVIEIRDRKGGDPSEWPEDLRVRQWPKGVAA